MVTMATFLRLDSKSLSELNLGLLLGIIGLGLYGMSRVGPYSIIGSIAWAPHAYNYVIWGAFGALVVWRRWGIFALPALFMIYSVDEIIWTTTYVATTCDQWNVNVVHDMLTGPLGYYIMIWIIGGVTFYILRPKIKIRWFIWGPWLFWFVAYVFVFHIPIMGNLCIGTVIPGNLGWEVLWQFAYLLPAYFTFYPRNSPQK